MSEVNKLRLREIEINYFYGMKPGTSASFSSEKIKFIEKQAFDKAIEALKVINQMISRYEECAESDSILKKGMSFGVYTVLKREIEVLKELGCE